MSEKKLSSRILFLSSIKSVYFQIVRRKNRVNAQNSSNAVLRETAEKDRNIVPKLRSSLQTS